MDMTGFDIVVLLIVGALAVLGAIRGFVTEILTLLAWVAAVVALKLFYPAGKLIAAGMVGSEVAAAASQQGPTAGSRSRALARAGTRHT